MSKFVHCERDQPYLLPQDMREWVSEEDLAHFVLEAVEMVKIDQFQVNQRGTGSAQCEPRMMLALLIYCHAHDIFSPRRIERATLRDLGLRYMTANLHPDHATVAQFRRENLTAVGECFLQVLLLAKGTETTEVGDGERGRDEGPGSGQQVAVGDVPAAGGVRGAVGTGDQGVAGEGGGSGMAGGGGRAVVAERVAEAAAGGPGEGQEGAGGVRAEGGGPAGARGSRTPPEATERGTGGEGPEQPDGSGRSADEEEPAGGFRAVLQRAGDSGGGGGGCECVDGGGGASEAA